MESKAPARAGGHVGTTWHRASGARTSSSLPPENKQGPGSRLLAGGTDAVPQTTPSVALTKRPVSLTPTQALVTQTVRRIVAVSTTTSKSGRMDAVHDGIVARLEGREEPFQQAVMDGLLDEWVRRARGPGESMDPDAYTDAVSALAMAMGGEQMSSADRAWWSSRIGAMSGRQQAHVIALTFWSVLQATMDPRTADTSMRDLWQVQGDYAAVLEPGEMGLVCATLAAGIDDADLPAVGARDLMHALLEESRYTTETLGYMAWALGKLTCDETRPPQTPAQLMLGGDIGAVFTRVLELAAGQPPVQLARLVRGVATALQAECSIVREDEAQRVPHGGRPDRESKLALSAQDSLPDVPALLLAQLTEAPDGIEPMEVFAMACGLATTVGRRADALCARVSQEKGDMATMLRYGLRAAGDPLRLLDEQDLPVARRAGLLALACEIEGVLDACSAPRQREALKARPQAHRELAMPLLLRHGQTWLKDG